MEMLPGHDWNEDRTLRTAQGKTLRRYGDAAAASRMLNDCDRHDVYALIKAGLIDGYQLKPWAKNSKWHIDLLSVWRFKQSQIAGKKS